MIPGENMKPILSGNYLLIVYEEGKESPVLSKRMMIVDEKVSIEAEVKEQPIRTELPT